MQRDESAVSIELVNPIRLPRFANYETWKEILSAEDREIQVSFAGEKLFSTVVAKTVFNPCTRDPVAGSDAKALTHLILTGAIPVRERRVVDLGCGSGVIGLSCILAGASSVLFTDVNPNVMRLQEHRLLRGDSARYYIKVQDLLCGEADESFDVVITSVPAVVIVDESSEVPAASHLSGIAMKADFNQRVVREAGRVLARDGLLVMATRVSLETTMPYHDLLLALHSEFDLNSMKHLNDQEPEGQLRALVRAVLRRVGLHWGLGRVDRSVSICFSVSKRGRPGGENREGGEDAAGRG